MKRFLFNASKAYVMQLDAAQEYESLCPVYGLAILNATFHTKKDKWYHHYKVSESQDSSQTIEGLELVFVELPKFTPRDWSEKKTGGFMVTIFKGNKRGFERGSQRIPRRHRDCQGRRNHTDLFLYKRTIGRI